ncbi:hypothetical protein CONCODRAFT_71386 [Conidiobolus coronatus NRRL 28638]|uniref:Type I restriction enzyme R protein N-terminal domain-containing protein n=1 Tax=Conidiobolus coronatus (strain ATCC 28846 / CBS 209.66 / NRRL 28638) TaxID=796925 RepID=A0A137P3J7_CONC2|nr:hypothetical protein CONCODRAFT_71386 [Conidiobolus coronatus NRRL 28638]|eukprot:KXN69595.1 hypothetical protein CONCODRAFT_71386 [Conidiobolus coronatus NRRL 28638]
MDGKEFLINKINRYRGLPSEFHYETNVTAIVNLLLDICDIRGIYGYIIKDESYMIAVRKSIPSELKYRKGDKLIFKETDKPIRGGYLVEEEKPLLIIECKSHRETSDVFLEKDNAQLVTYMSTLNFPYGVLISEYKASIYKGKYTSRSTNVEHERDIGDIVENIDNLMGFIKKACKYDDV